MGDTGAGEPRYLGTKEAAAYLGISAKTLEKLRVTGKGPPYAKAGRRVIYDRRDLDKWVAKRKRRFTGESVEDDGAPAGDTGAGDGDESVEEDGAGPGDSRAEDGGDSDEEDDANPGDARAGDGDGSGEDSGPGR